MNPIPNSQTRRIVHLTKEQRLPKCFKDVEKVIRTVKSCRSNFKTVLANSRFRGSYFKKVYSLTVNVLKYYNYIQEIISKTNLLEKEKFLQRELASVLIYEIIFGKGFLPGESKVVTIIQGYENEIMNAHQILQSSDAGSFIVKEINIPRYVRVHTLVTTVSYVIKDLESLGFKQIVYNSDITEEKYLELVRSLEPSTFLIDFQFKDILVFERNENLIYLDLYIKGHIFLQDKASYIPVHVLNPEPGSAVLDACAAPGMKTVHIASKMKNKGILIACERDKTRFESLKEMIQYGAVKISKVLCKDFKLLDPNDQAYSTIEYILLDPSCSGSGMVNRMDEVTDREDSKNKERLMKLSGFQIILLKHALKFPSVKKVVYSTCSVNEEENEYVVHEVLKQCYGTFKLVSAMPEWSERGSENFEFGKLCLRTVPEKHLTNGFFVAMFQRVDSDEYRKSAYKKCEVSTDLLDKGSIDLSMKKKNKGAPEWETCYNKGRMHEAKNNFLNDANSNQESSFDLNKKMKHKSYQQSNHLQNIYDKSLSSDHFEIEDASNLLNAVPESHGIFNQNIQEVQVEKQINFDYDTKKNKKKKKKRENYSEFEEKKRNKLPNPVLESEQECSFTQLNTQEVQVEKQISFDYDTKKSKKKKKRENYSEFEENTHNKLPNLVLKSEQKCSFKGTNNALDDSTSISTVKEKHKHRRNLSIQNMFDSVEVIDNAADDSISVSTVKEKHKRKRHLSLENMSDSVEVIVNEADILHKKKKKHFSKFESSLQTDCNNELSLKERNKKLKTHGKDLNFHSSDLNCSLVTETNLEMLHNTSASPAEMVGNLNSNFQTQVKDVGVLVKFEGNLDSTSSKSESKKAKYSSVLNRNIKFSPVTEQHEAVLLNSEGTFISASNGSDYVKKSKKYRNQKHKIEEVDNAKINNERISHYSERGILCASIEDDSLPIKKSKKCKSKKHENEKTDNYKIIEIVPQNSEESFICNSIKNDSLISKKSKKCKSKKHENEKSDDCNINEIIPHNSEGSFICDSIENNSLIRKKSKKYKSRKHEVEKNC